MLSKLAGVLLSLLMLLGWLVGGPADPVIPIGSGMDEMDGVTVRLVEATAVDADDFDAFFDVNTVVEIENSSDEPIMQVVYGIDLLDADGEVLRGYSETYTATDGAIPPGETRVDRQTGCRWKKDGTLAAAGIRVSSVATEAQMPLVHLPEPGEPLYRALGDERLANINNEPPTCITVGIDQGGYLREAVFDTPGELGRAVDLLCAVRIGRPSDTWVTDNYNYIVLDWADGTYTSIIINLHSLEFHAYGQYYMYELENLGGLWSYAEQNAVEVF